MKVYQINIFGNLSTGKIAVDIYKVLKVQGHDGKIAFARGTIEDGIPHYKIGTDLDVKIHALMTRITDKTGFYSKKATYTLINDIKAYSPDVIHLHNIHGYYINIELLFNFLKAYNKPVVWTLHDCWAFTGHCAHFDFVGCDKWKTGCHHCPQKHTYPASKLFDASDWNWRKKKDLFAGLDMTLVTPSYWLADLVKQSFLQEHKVVTIHNGIDTSIFKPTPSDFRVKNGLEDSFIILGVASEWTDRKGLADFIKLNALLKNDARYKIVLVGLNDKQLSRLPKDVLGINRTNSAKELAEIYSTADVFFNPTYEDNYPTVNLEAIACGTPVVAYKTGGSPESVNKNCGLVIAQGDLEAAVAQFKKMSQGDSGVTYASQAFSKEMCFVEYGVVYKKVL